MSLTPPKDWGQSLAAWLHHHGHIPVTPHIRASDYYTCATDPFRYYVERRLGLQSAFSYSEALRHGSWLHKCIELDPFVVEWTLAQWTNALRPYITARQEELKIVCDTFNIRGDNLAAILRREEEDALTVAAWYSGERSVPVGNGRSFVQHMTNPNYEIIGREVGLRIPNPIDPSHPDMAGRIDLLYLNKISNSLVIVDAKSTAKATSVRLAGCAWEYATLHYIHLLHHALQNGLLRRLYPDLPAEVKVGGMIHVAFEKPGIRLSDQDRDYEDVDFTPSKGPNKGITRKERRWSGEPKFSNYQRRVQDWVFARNDYLHLRTERSSDPVVNMSWTPAFSSDASPIPGVLDEVRYPHFRHKYDIIARYATASPEPHNFPVNDQTLVDPFSKRYTAWGALAATRPAQWPDVIRQERLVTTHREDPLHEPASND